MLEDDYLDEEDEEFEDETIGKHLYYTSQPEYSTFHSIAKVPERSILPDLKRLEVPDDVRMEAESIFQKLETKTKRGKRRKKLLFYCIFKAYKNLKQPKDPKVIAEMVDIPQREIKKAFSMFSAAQTSYSSRAVFHSPSEFIPEYHKSLGLSEDCLPDIIDFVEEILELDQKIKSNSKLSEDYPQVVAAGILLYWLINKQSMNVNKKHYTSQIVRRSEMTISKMYRRIGEIYNSA